MISEKKLRSRRLPRVYNVYNHKILNFAFAAFLIFCGICGAKSQSFSKTQTQSRSQRENSASQKSFFWENAKEISDGDSYFPQAVSSGKKSFVFFEQADKKSKNVRISYSECENSKNWSGIKNLGGKIAYSGEKVPDIFSAAVSKNGTVAVSVLDSSFENENSSENQNGILKVFCLKNNLRGDTKSGTKSGKKNALKGDSDIIAENILKGDSEIDSGTGSQSGSKSSSENSENPENWSVFYFPRTEKHIVSSRIFADGDGFILFVSLGEGSQSLTDSSFSLLYSESADGENWSGLKTFSAARGISNPLSPFFAKISGRDFVFFEGWLGSDPSSSQIYCSIKYSGKYSGIFSGGWSEPVLVTGEISVFDGENYGDFKNFRPFVLSDGKETKIAWERSEKSSETAFVMAAPLNLDGSISDKNDVEKLNPYGNGRRPNLFLYGGKFFATWFDDRNGANNVYLYENLGVDWAESESLRQRQTGRAAFSFGCPVVSLDEKGNEALTFFWQQNLGKESKICILERDSSVEKPVLSARNFTAGNRGRKKEVSARIIFPKDISEIAGYSAIVTQDENENPPESEFAESFHRVSRVSTISRVSGGANSALISGKIDENIHGDQKLYFKARVLDGAGNWSEPAVLEYYYDVTPPLPPSDIYFSKDNFGFASSNDVAFSWKNGWQIEEVAGFSWTFSQISKLDDKFSVSRTKKLSMSEEDCKKSLEEILEKNLEKSLGAKSPGSKILGKNTRASYKNRANGLYLFSVSAVDTAGNVSEPASAFVFLNKFKAAVKIDDVQAKIDELGTAFIEISGFEFKSDGTVSEVVLTEKDSGEKISFAQKDFTVVQDKSGKSKIEGLEVKNLQAGSYKVQIRHTGLGVSSWSKNLVVGENGTVKYERQYNFEPVWISFDAVNPQKYGIDIEKLVLVFIFAFLLLGIALSLRGLVLSVKDAVKIKNDVLRILKGDSVKINREFIGDIMSVEKKGKLEIALKVRFSLKFKLGLFTTVLLLFIVAGVALSIGIEMSRTQEQILISGLKERVNVVMGNMSSGVQTYLPDGREKLTELGSIVNQTDNFDEASYATIVSYQIDGEKLSDGSSPMDYVWATNDHQISSKIDSKTFDAGNVRAKNFEMYGKISQKIESDAKNLLKANPNLSSDEKFAELNRLSLLLADSYPHLDDEKLEREHTEYMFYWPVLYEQANAENYLHALILLKVNTENLVSQVEKSNQLTFGIAVVAAAVASLIGLICAILLSSVIVNPIKRVVQHVKVITETSDKENLDGYKIRIKTHDELRTLGDSVNEMTEGLVKGARDEKLAKKESERAAKAREEAAKAQAEEAKARAETAEMNIVNLDGQAVQKAFIPLVSEGAEKSTAAQMSDDDIQVYGYYEGTDAVSGDYFDYKKLDDRYYAFIKCDASGHGVPAALIMTIVATIFRRYFDSWDIKKQGTKLNSLLVDINDFIESLGLQGKFAAMIICLLDSKTGDLYMSNAGDNVVHYFDSVERKVKILTLHESPAAGPLPSFMVEMKGGYKVEKFNLKKSDILFLYTDGIEESTRYFRDSSCNIAECREPGLKTGEIHETHKAGERSEQLEAKRVQDVIEAVLNRKKYVLKKYHSPNPNEKLEFDFEKCDGTIKDAITALAAVEKVFRIYKKPESAGKVERTEITLDGKTKSLIQISGDGIKIDRKIDAFLAKTFSLYDFYCKNKVDMGEQNYVYYTGVSEDSQSDDLTLLAIERM